MLNGIALLLHRQPLHKSLEALLVCGPQLWRVTHVCSSHNLALLMSTKLFIQFTLYKCRGFCTKPLAPPPVVTVSQALKLTAKTSGMIPGQFLRSNEKLPRCSQLLFVVIHDLFEAATVFYTQYLLG